MNLEMLQNKGTLLIVDDVADNIKVLLDFLTSKQFTVLVAQNGKKALQKAAYAQPDLILLDVMLPDLDGFEICRVLKSQEETKEIPIIFMTALTDVVDKIKGFELGAADYITKPFQHEEVLARVNTHLKLCKLQQALQIHMTELEKRNMELEAFSRTVAHDLKNPLSVLTNYIELAVGECTVFSEDFPLKLLRSALKSGYEMANIINALLLLAGVSKQREVELHPLDMGVLIDQVIEERINLSEYQGSIMKPQHWPVAKGYVPWIKEVWTNYFTNGLKYGGTPPQLKLGAEVQQNGMVRFWVRDNGTGIEPEAQTRLFTPFTRLHTHRVEGHGLGLSIVQQIIEKHGGQVGVESTLGQGSTFYFTLPMAT